MAKFCLVPALADKFEKMILDGKIDIDKLSKASNSKERYDFFAKEFGERNAREMNAAFESKLLLKNQQIGFADWAKQLTGVSKETKQDLVSRIGRMEKVLTPNEEGEFLNELINKKLGIEVTDDQIAIINEMSNKIKEMEAITDKNDIDIPLNLAKMELTDYVNSLATTRSNLVTDILGLPRAIMAGLDLSAALNQAWGMVSRANFWKNFSTMFKAAGSEKGYREIMAGVMGHPLFKYAKKAGIRLTDLSTNLTKREENVMTTFLDKVPFMRGSQRAYTAFLNKLRMDEFARIYKRLELTNADVGMGSKAVEQIANVVNNFTGGAKVGKVEGANPWLNNLFFSPRKIASTLQMLNPLNYLDPRINSVARQEALRNLVGSVAVTAGVLTLAKSFGTDVEKEAISSDFGKIVSGRARLDVSGGNASYVTLLARLLSGKTKSTTTGETKELGNEFGDTSKASLVGQAMRYKLAPTASLLFDALIGANAIGEEKTIPQSVIDRAKPMFLNSVWELYNSDAEFKEAFTAIALFGGGLNVYDVKEKKKSKNKSKSLFTPATPKKKKKTLF